MRGWNFHVMSQTSQSNIRNLGGDLKTRLPARQILGAAPQPPPFCSVGLRYASNFHTREIENNYGHIGPPKDPCGGGGARESDEKLGRKNRGVRVDEIEEKKKGRIPHLKTVLVIVVVGGVGEGVWGWINSKKWTRIVERKVSTTSGGAARGWGKKNFRR